MRRKMGKDGKQPDNIESFHGNWQSIDLGQRLPLRVIHFFMGINSMEFESRIINFLFKKIDHVLKYAKADVLIDQDILADNGLRHALATAHVEYARLSEIIDPEVTADQCYDLQCIFDRSFTFFELLFA